MKRIMLLLLICVFYLSLTQCNIIDPLTHQNIRLGQSLPHVHLSSIRRGFSREDFELGEVVAIYDDNAAVYGVIEDIGTQNEPTITVSYGKGRVARLSPQQIRKFFRGG